MCVYVCIYNVAIFTNEGPSTSQAMQSSEDENEDDGDSLNADVQESSDGESDAEVKTDCTETNFGNSDEDISNPPHL